MNRRTFLTTLAAVPVALIVPELLIPKRTFFLPPSQGWAQPSLADLWLRYTSLVVPVGVAVMVPHVGERLRVIEDMQRFSVSLEIPRYLDIQTEWRMRRSMSNAPTYNGPATIAALMPWVTS